MRLSKEEFADVPHLFSTQEEADSRMILHVFEADQQYKQNGCNGQIVVQASDTDVMVLLTHYYNKLIATSELWMYMGKITAVQDRRRFVAIHTISDALGISFCNILSAVLCLSGCDTVSSLLGIGKKKTHFSK